VVLIAGEAGIGKSRLAAEGRGRAAARGMGILQGNCHERDSALPYAPLLDLLHGFIVSHSPDELARYLGPTAFELAKLLPELVTRVPDLAPSPPVEPELEKRRLFHALAGFLIRLASLQPLAVTIEDLHWSDETSLDFLLFLARRIAAQPIVLLLTFRSDVTPAPLRHWLAALDRERLATELTLTRLTREEADAMLRAIFGLPHPIRRDFLHVVYGLTEGNPFFVEEVLKALVDSGGIFYADGRWDRRPMQELAIPRSVQPRVAGLSQATRETLMLAAVTGRRFNFALLQELTQMNESELLQQIRQLMDAQLVVEESADQFAFRHALTREAVYSTLLLRERKRHHLAVAETLERLYAGAVDVPVGDLALHFFQAGVWDKAVRYSRAAGERAQAMYAAREAAEHFTRALEAAGHLAQPPPLAPLYRARGQSFETMGEFELARADYEAALQAARAAGDRRGEWQGLLDLGFLWAARDYAQTGEYLQQSLVLARALGDPATLGHTLNRVGN
jgi:predicted ATPase